MCYNLVCLECIKSSKQPTTLLFSDRWETTALYSSHLWLWKRLGLQVVGWLGGCLGLLCLHPRCWLRRHCPGELHCLRRDQCWTQCTPQLGGRHSELSRRVKMRWKCHFLIWSTESRRSVNTNVKLNFHSIGIIKDFKLGYSKNPFHKANLQPYQNHVWGKRSLKPEAEFSFDVDASLSHSHFPCFVPLFLE